MYFVFCKLFVKFFLCFCLSVCCLEPLYSCTELHGERYFVIGCFFGFFYRNAICGCNPKQMCSGACASNQSMMHFVCIQTTAKCAHAHVCCACKYVNISAFALHYSSHRFWIYGIFSSIVLNWNHHWWIFLKCSDTNSFSVFLSLAFFLCLSLCRSLSHCLCNLNCLLFHLFIEFVYRCFSNVWSVNVNTTSTRTEMSVLCTTLNRYYLLNLIRFWYSMRAKPFTHRDPTMHVINWFVDKLIE